MVHGEFRMDDARLAGLTERMKRRHELERKSSAAERQAQAQARRFYCRMRPCWACDSFGECSHRERGIMALSADVLMREARRAAAR